MVATLKTKRNGYTIKITHSCEELPSYITFYSFEDFQKISNIENVMGELNNESIRENEDEFYEYLKKIESVVKDCEKMKYKSDVEDIFGYAFPNIDSFFYEVRNEYVPVHDENGFHWKRKENSDKSERVVDKFDEIRELLLERNIYC